MPSGRSGGPTPADISRLTEAIKDHSRATKALTDGVRALNTNLVAIHDILKESNNDE